MDERLDLSSENLTKALFVMAMLDELQLVVSYEVWQRCLDRAKESILGERNDTPSP